MKNLFNRRNFIRQSLTVAGATSVGLKPVVSSGKQLRAEESMHIIGPREGYSPQIGTLLSMMTWMRTVVLISVENLKQSELDYLHDADSNTIGAMLLHLAATERYYQINTFDWKMDFNGDGKIDWDAAMNLGDKGRKVIKGNSLEYYQTILKETRDTTTNEFKKRGDEWLMKVDPKFFGNQPTNNYCKWFHVCEHESNHNGQIKYIKSRLS
jgi:hypothetical protein